MKRPNNFKSNDGTSKEHNENHQRSNNNNLLLNSASSSASTAEDTTFSPFVASTSGSGISRARWLSRQLMGRGGQGENQDMIIPTDDRRLLTMEMQVLSGSVGALTLAFVNRVLSLDAQVILTLWVITVGMLVYVVITFVQGEVQEVRRRGLIAYMPESMNRLLTHTSLHEWMIDPTFMLENRHLLIYFLGLSPEQLDQAIDRLPRRRQEDLRRPGLSWLLPESIQSIILPAQQFERSGESVQSEIVSYSARNMLTMQSRSPTYNDAIEGILAMLVSPFVLGTGNFEDIPSEDSHGDESPSFFNLDDTEVINNGITRNISRRSTSSDDLSMDLGLTLEDELGGGILDSQVEIIARRLNFFDSNVALEVTEERNANARIIEEAHNSDESENLSDEYTQEGQVISDAISSLLGNFAVSIGSAAENALEYSMDSIAPAVTITGVGSLIGIGAIYLQPLLQRSMVGGRATPSTSETSTPIIIGLGLSALGAGGFFWFRSNLKKTKKG